MTKLKETRKLLGFSEQELANLLGVSKQLVNQWENNKRSIPLERRIQMKEIFFNKSQVIIDSIINVQFE